MEVPGRKERGRRLQGILSRLSRRFSLFVCFFSLLLVSAFINFALFSAVLQKEGNERKEAPVSESEHQPAQPEEWRVEKEEEECPMPDALGSSALSRMTSRECKSRLMSIACSIANHSLHPDFPENSCSLFDSTLAGREVGCFSDSVKKRLLDGFSYSFKADNSHEKCRAHCYRAGFVFYGLEFGHECFCGDSIEGGRMVGAEQCQRYICPGRKDSEENETLRCGGFDAISVAHTGFTRRVVWEKPKYIEESKNENQLPIRILFVLQLNGRNVRQVRHMLSLIYSPHHFYYIHVDIRQKYMLREARRLSSLLPNVMLASQSRATIWGGASLLPMFLDALRESADLEWEYAINMSESDFPVLTLGELDAQLRQNRGKSFLASHGYSTARFIQKQGFDYVFLECENRMWRVARRPSFPPRLALNGGSDWVVVHRELAEFALVEKGDQLPPLLRGLFASFILPLESFFHTLAMNSRFCMSVVAGNLRVTNWNRKQGCRCASLKKVVDWCGCSPLVFNRQTAHAKFALEKAKERSVYFARKFETLISTEAIALASHQASRGRPHLLPDSAHPSTNSSLVNFFDSSIDEMSEARLVFMQSFLQKDGSSWEMFVYREKDEAPYQIVISANKENEDGEKIVESLFSLVAEEEVVEAAEVRGFALNSISVGVSLDHKEEIFRGFDAFISVPNGAATILLEWSQVVSDDSIPENQTSPAGVTVEWWDGSERHVATQTLPAYDSFYGRQFAVLDLSEMEDAIAGVWRADVKTGQDGSLLGSVSFPVYDNSPSLAASLTSRFYREEGRCHGLARCQLSRWSSLFPDPKSDINHGYDAHTDRLY